MPKAWTARLDQALTDVANAAAEAKRARDETLAFDPKPLVEAATAPLAARFAQAERQAQAAHEAAQRALAVPRDTTGEQTLAAFRALARILSVRVLLLLAVAGAFALAVMAMAQQSWSGLALTAVFCLLTIGPLAWLEVGTRPKSHE